MDGLSGAASGMAVFSLAVELAGGIKKLHDFWDSVTEAPEDIHAINEDLGLLSSVLAEMANEEQHSGPDQTLTRALKACCDKINKLTRITNDIEPGFASRSFRIRKWTAFKAVLKGEKILKFQKVLESLKINLMLAQQSHLTRLNRVRYQSHRQDLMAITKSIGSLKLEQISATVTTVGNSSCIDNNHTSAFRAETSRICRNIENPVQRLGFELASDVAVTDLARGHSKDPHRPSQPLANVKTDRSNHPSLDELSRMSRQQTSKKYTSATWTQTFFGRIMTTTTTRVSRSRFVDDGALDGDYDDDKCQYEYESSFKILPAQWLLKLGFNYAYDFSTCDSSTQSWQCSIKPIHLVPNDALIFNFCSEGNLEKVRDLFSRKLASVRDVDSHGWTPLHFAVRSHSPELCKFLIDAGADRNARTFDCGGQRPLRYITPGPLRYITLSPIAKNGDMDAINTCRIFEDCFDFWDENGDVWHILEAWPKWNSGTIVSREIEAMLAFISWFITSSSPDIKANYNIQKIRWAIQFADDEVADAVGLLLRLDPRRVQDLNNISSDGNTLLMQHVIERNWKIVIMLLAGGADPHQVQRASSSSYSPVAESPLSISMYASWTLWGFRNVLYARGLRVEDIVREELKEGAPLLNAGWRTETLTALLELGFEPEIAPHRTFLGYLRCSNCNVYIHYSEVAVQPYWQGVIESIKNGTHPRTICSDTQDEQPSTSQCNPPVLEHSARDTTDRSALSQASGLSEDQAAQPDLEPVVSGDGASSTTLDRGEVWCIKCWWYYKETGSRWVRATFKTKYSDGDDFSPYHIHT